MYEENKKTPAEAAILGFYEAANKGDKEDYNVREILTSYDKVLKEISKQPLIVACRLQISDPILQKKFEHNGQINESEIKKLKATSLKLPLVLAQEDSKYLALFIRKYEINKSAEASRDINCLEVRLLKEVYEEIIKGEDIAGAIINPFSDHPFVIDIKHMLHAINGCPKEDLEKEINEAINRRVS